MVSIRKKGQQSGKFPTQTDVFDQDVFSATQQLVRDRMLKLEAVDPKFFSDKANNRAEPTN